MLKLANTVFQDLKKEYSDFVLISPHGGMNHFVDEFEKVEKFDKKTLYNIIVC